MHIFKLVRWKNLLFLTTALFLMQTAVVNPILFIFGFTESALSTLEVTLLILTNIFIVAGGYVINDYFDVKIDEINKPLTRIVGRLMDRRKAMIIHQVLTITGSLCGLVLAYLTQSLTLGLFALFLPGLLWFYSASYKRQFFIGNLIVALHAFLATISVAIANASKLTSIYGDLIHETPILKELYSWIGGFSVFVFLCVLLREIIKDIEDEKGDRELECHTLPIKWGITKTKITLYALIAFMGGLLCYVNFSLLSFEETLSTRYLIFGLLLPLIILVYLIATATKKHDYKNASTLCQYILLLGILYSLIFYFIQAKVYGIPLFNLLVIQP